MEDLNPQQAQAKAIQTWRQPNPFARPRWSSLYRGPGLPESYIDQINPPEKRDIDLIFDSIRQIVETRQGERLLEPQFGSKVFELIGEPLDIVFENKVRIFLTDSVKQYEPRARIVGVTFVYVNHEAQITYNMEMVHLGATAQGTLKIPRLI